MNEQTSCGISITWNTIQKQKKNAILIHVKTWLNCTNIMLSEISQTLKTSCYIIILKIPNVYFTVFVLVMMLLFGVGEVQ